MAKKLHSRAKQVHQDAHTLIEAGANELFAPEDGIEPLISDLTAKWVAATLLSRAFNLEIPTQNLNGAHPQQKIPQTRCCESSSAFLWVCARGGFVLRIRLWATIAHESQC